MSHIVKIIIISVFLIYLLYTHILIKIEMPIFIALSSINKYDINFNLLLLPENQTNPIPMYYINMNQSVDRRNRFLDRMSKFNNYNIIRINAITPEVLYNYKINIPRRCMGMHDKEISCLLSHYKAIQTSYNNNDKYSIIAEDDMIIEKNINWDYFISVLPKDWEIIQLYYFKAKYINNNHFKDLQKQKFLIKTNNNLTSAAAYLINKKGMQNILQHINNNEINLLNHNNPCLADFVVFYNINRYILTYPIIRTEELDSTLNPHHLALRKNDL
jgi:GR25 family glycosyltransferase involved in LPS biosynthesis